MNKNGFNSFCNSLWATTTIIQWRGSHVWKVGGKVFAIGRWGNRKHTGITFKVSDIAFEMLQQEPGLQPAPYFASRGMKWINDYGKPGLPTRDLQSYIFHSHQIVFSSLTKKIQAELTIKHGENKQM